MYKGKICGEKEVSTEIDRNKLLDKEFWQRATIGDVTRVIAEDASVHDRDENGATPLHYAAALSRTSEMIMPLFDAGADVRANDNNGKTPLHLATALSKIPEIIVLLLDRGADINSRNENNATPLLAAAAFNDMPGITALLLKRGADIHALGKDGDTPLHFAAGFNKPDVVTLLLEHGANPSVRDNNGKTPFDWAKKNEFLRGSDVYRLLKEKQFQ